MIGRATTSYQEEVAAHAQRVADGTQPDVPFMEWYHAYPATAAYLLVLWALYSWMQQRKEPFRLKTVLLIYNLVCVLLAGAVCVLLLYTWPDKLICNTRDVSTPTGKLRAFATWLYYIQKFFEYFDTFFFVLRQSWRQITFLHIYHHASVALVVREFMLYDINGDSYLAAFLNSTIHVMMYSHYFLSALGVNTWWRRYLTMGQLLQFSIILVQMCASFLIGPQCGVPDYLKVLQICYQISMLVLFSQFYTKAYREEGASKKEKTKKEN